MPDLTQEQYDKAYNEEMTKLDAEAEKSTTEVAKTDETEAEQTGKTNDTTQDEKVEQTDLEKPVDKTDERFEKMEKSLKETQRWAHENAAEVKRLKREAEQRERAENRPAMLETNPGLEEAIRYVSNVPAVVNPQEIWIQTVEKALPELNKLLDESPDFRALAEQKSFEMGASWSDPLVATRELGKLQAQFESKQAVDKAVEAARKDFATKQKKSTAMQVPGGGGSKVAPQLSEVDRINNMPQADFIAMRNKALGF